MVVAETLGYKGRVSEARDLTRDWTRELAGTPLPDVVRLVEAPVARKLTGPSGRAYRGKGYAFWDMEPYESDLYVRTKVTGRGLRFFERYYGVDVRSPERDFASFGAEPDVSATWTENLTWALFGLIGLAAIGVLVGLGLLLLEIV